MMFKNWKEFEQTVLELNYHQSQEVLEQLARRTASPSQAFALAYQAAMLQLVPAFDPKQWAAFCVSESQGNHPRQLQAQAHIDSHGTIVLNGEKTFVTHGKHAKQLVVIAKSHDPDEIGRLRAYLLMQGSTGVEISESRPAGILPELDHGKLLLHNAPTTMLKGDGHSDYSKRFRLLEDQYMLLVFSNHIAAQVERIGSDKSIQNQAEALTQKVNVNGDLDAKGVLALGYHYEALMDLSNQYTHWLQKYPELQQQWQRDSKLFLLAKKAREIRTSQAEQALQ